MRLKGRPLKQCRSKLSAISFLLSVLRPTFPLQVIRYWNPFTGRDLVLRIFNGAVGSSSLCYTAWTAECRQRWRPDAFNFTNDKNNAQFSWTELVGVVATLQYCVTWLNYWLGYCLWRKGFRVFLQSFQVNSEALFWNTRGGTLVKNSQKTKINGVDTNKIHTTDQVSM